MTYLRTWGLYRRGFRWLWTRQLTKGIAGYYDRGHEIRPIFWGVCYKPGWGPWRFLPVYLTTYLVGVALGFGVVSISRVLWERGWHRPVDWVFRSLGRGDNHCRDAGPRLWGSVDCWR